MGEANFYYITYLQNERVKTILFFIYCFQ